MTTLLSALAGDDEIEALLSDEAQVQTLLAVETALAEASAEAGWISPAAAAAIVSAIAGFDPDWNALRAGMARDGVVVPELVRQLRTRVEEPHRPALHRGATSQDIIDTALILQLSGILDILSERIENLLPAIAELSNTAGHKPLMAHTRMQAALPTTWASKLATWRDPLQRLSHELFVSRRALLVVQLGGPVGDRSSFDGLGDAVATALARRLDLGIAAPWHATRDPIVALGNRLALISGTLGKIGADVTLLAQSEVGAVTLTGGGGSSAMTHKSNPVAAEALVALARFNAGLAGTLQQAVVHEYERSGAAWTLEWLTLPHMLVTTGASLRLGAELLRQIRIA